MRRRDAPPLLILLNGELERPGIVRGLARRAAAVLCADGGARHAAALGLEPRLIIGDMDSLPAKRPAWPSATYLCDFDPDASDFEKVLRFAADRGSRAAWVAGALGGRLDHTLVNLALIERYSGRIRLTLAGAMNAEVLGPGAHALPCGRGQAVTLLPVSGRARVTTRGLAYALRRAWLERDSRGLSNRAVAADVRIEVHAGRLWALY